VLKQVVEAQLLTRNDIKLYLLQSFPQLNNKTAG
jgi:hypothetical protein